VLTIGDVRVLFVNVSAPVNDAFEFKAVCVAVLTGLLASLVLSTLDKPIFVLACNCSPLVRLCGAYETAVDAATVAHTTS